MQLNFRKSIHSLSNAKKVLEALITLGAPSSEIHISVGGDWEEDGEVVNCDHHNTVGEFNDEHVKIRSMHVWLESDDFQYHTIKPLKDSYIFIRCDTNLAEDGVKDNHEN